MAGWSVGPSVCLARRAASRLLRRMLLRQSVTRTQFALRLNAGVAGVPVTMTTTFAPRAVGYSSRHRLHGTRYHPAVGWA